MVFNVTFNNISAISRRSDLLVEETGVPEENHRPVASRVLFVLSFYGFFTFLVPCCDVRYDFRFVFTSRDRRGRDRMVVAFTVTYATSAYHHYRCEFESRSGEMYLI
jgi:hypothetical protein